MTDEELARWLGIAGTKDCAAIMAAVTPEKRAEYEAFAKVELEIILWDQGLGPLPAGVIACGERQIREGRGPVRRKAKKRKANE